MRDGKPGIPKAVALAELDAVLAASDFDASERNRRFLKYVVTETLEGRGDRIKGYNIAIEVFGRPPSFDAQTDPIVRIEARRLRRSLERYYLMAGKDAAIRICIPKGSYVPCFDGAEDGETGPCARPADVVATAARHPGPSIFVSAFEAEGDQSSFPNFTNGLTRQIIVGLTRFTDLVVFGPDTTREIGSQIERERIRTELGADLLLTGGTSLSSDRFGVEALLIDLKTGQTVWAESYERRLVPANIIAVRDEVANSIAGTLAQPYGLIFRQKAREIEGAPPESLRSYACVVQFYQYWRTIAEFSKDTVRHCLEETILREPAYAEAYVCLSRIYSSDYRFDTSASLTMRASLDRARALAEKALDLAPASSHAHHAMAVVHWFAQDVEASFEAYEAGLALNPNDTQIMADLGMRHALQANWDRAVPLLCDSYARNPAQPTTYRVGLMLWHYAHDRFAQALAEARKVNAPDVIYPHLIVAISAAELGRHDEARAAVGRMLSIDPGYAERVASDLERRNVHPDLTRRVLDSLRKAGLKAGAGAPSA